MMKANRNSDKLPVADGVEKRSYPTDMQSALDFFEKNKGEVLLPDSYYAVVKACVQENTQELFLRNPSTPLKAIVASTLNELNPNIPGDKIIELAIFTVQCWNDLSAKSSQSLQKSRVPATV